ncbi:MAG: pilus assembly protein PilM [Candidatus Omnitrophica bacterium]|nr:pilus assembly protein PilM [Candidatus Omnitrophota bacterium]
MKLKQSRFISISISSAVVKTALVQSSGLVEKLARRDVDKSGPDAALRVALEGFPVKGAGVLCVIPGDVATTKILEVPSADREEIESILALQASRHTPFNKDEILTSYIKLGVPKPNFTRVLLIVVKRETVKDKLAIIKRAGLDISSVLFVPEGIARFYTEVYKIKKTDAPVAIIDVGMQSTNFIVASQCLLSMSRNIPIGLEHLAIDAESPAQMLNDIKASLDAYEHESGDRKPARFLITTNHMALAGLDTKISEVLTGTKVELAPYTNFLQANKAVKDVLARSFADDSALDVIAPAIVAVKCQAELVPQDIKDQWAIAEKGKATYAAGVLVILLLLSVGGALMSKVYYKDAFLNKNLIAKFADQRKEVSNIENLIRKTQVLRDYMADRDLSLEAIRELYRLTPEDIYLNNISMDDATGSITVQGAATTMSHVFTFVTALESSDLFEGVKTKSTSTKKDRDKTVATFELVMQLSKSEVNVKPNPAEAAAAAPDKSVQAK